MHITKPSKQLSERRLRGSNSIQRFSRIFSYSGSSRKISAFMCEDRTVGPPVCVCSLLFTNPPMRPKGPWQRLVGPPVSDGRRCSRSFGVPTELAERWADCWDTGGHWGGGGSVACILRGGFAAVALRSVLCNKNHFPLCAGLSFPFNPRHSPQ